MAGAFDASARFEEDLLVTADEIETCGAQTFSVLEQVARSNQPWAVDFKLVKEIHFRWFETTFPADAGEFRTQIVLNRKGTAVEVEAILPAIDNDTQIDLDWARRFPARKSGAPASFGAVPFGCMTPISNHASASGVPFPRIGG